MRVTSIDGPRQAAYDAPGRQLSEVQAGGLPVEEQHVVGLDAELLGERGAGVPSRDLRSSRGPLATDRPRGWRLGVLGLGDADQPHQPGDEQQADEEADHRAERGDARNHHARVSPPRALAPKSMAAYTR